MDVNRPRSVSEHVATWRKVKAAAKRNSGLTREEAGGERGARGEARAQRNVESNAL